MKFFGQEKFGAALDDESLWMDTIPVGLQCTWCGEQIGRKDAGVVMDCHGEGWSEIAFHIECQMRQVVGSVGHQQGLCSCNGGPGTMDDPTHMTMRQAAKAALVLFRKRQLMKSPSA